MCFYYSIVQPGLAVKCPRCMYSYEFEECGSSVNSSNKCMCATTRYEDPRADVGVTL